MDSLLLTELSTQKLMLRNTAIPYLEQLINQNYSKSKTGDTDAGVKFAKQHISVIGAVSADDWNDEDEDEDGKKKCDPSESRVLVVPVIGPTFKYDQYGWYSGRRGLDHYASIMSMAMNDDSISGVVMLFNTPGGSTQSLIQIEKVLQNKTKPVIAVVDGMCCSCGLHIACMCDKIYAESDMCEIGSIGVFAQILDDRKAMEDYGFKLIEVYPPESSYKNKGVRETLDGKPQYLIDNSLSPFALSFQEHVKANRPNLNLNVEGIIEGAVFYAKDAVSNGLIDKLASLQDAINEVSAAADTASKNKLIHSIF